MKITKKMMIKFRAFSLGAVANNFKAFRNRRVPF